jgi:hypothetical protein
VTGVDGEVYAADNRATGTSCIDDNDGSFNLPVTGGVWALNAAIERYWAIKPNPSVTATAQQNVQQSLVIWPLTHDQRHCSTRQRTLRAPLSSPRAGRQYWRFQRLHHQQRRGHFVLLVPRMNIMSAPGCEFGDDSFPTDQPALVGPALKR